MSNLIPPIPAWEGLHPLVIHFPIALLLVVPLGLLASLVLPAARRPVIVGTFVLMALGAGSIVLATMTGEAAGEAAENTPAAKAILERHEDLAELSRNIFLALTGVYALVVLLPALMRKSAGRALQTGIGIAFLLVYLASGTVLARAAHEGGRLVHEVGVHASMGATAATVNSAAPSHGDD
jgi:uncharacterized membrane protein